MAMDQQQRLKVIIELHEGEKLSTKVWRFFSGRNYTKDEVEAEVTSLFPHIIKKGLRLSFFYHDDLAGRVHIESDGDMQAALQCFIDEWDNERRKEYLILHAEDCQPVQAEGTSSGTTDAPEQHEQPLKNRKRKRKRFDDPDLSALEPKRSLGQILGKCDKEDVESSGIMPLPEQPLYEDETCDKIKCRWCPNWIGSAEPRVINQHVRKAASHKTARSKELQVQKGTAGQMKDANVHCDVVDIHNQTTDTNDQTTDTQAHIASAEGLVECQGMYSRKYTVLHNDRHGGCTTVKKLWEDGRQVDLKHCPLSNDAEYVQTTCECCTTLKEWKQTHPSLAKSLQKIADQPRYYALLPKEKISVDGKEMMGTIRALSGAPLGPCTKVARVDGPHPYTCDACDALVHGQTSVLNRRLLRDNQLKHPRSQEERAIQSGVNHKYCSPTHLQIALNKRKVNEHLQADKIVCLSKANEKLLHNSWHRCTSVRPFIESLITLFEEGKVSTFDFNFIKNWVGKKVKGRFYHADEQARNLAILFSNKLGEKMYTTTAPLLGLPSERQARRLRMKETKAHHYLPGLNNWAFEKAQQNASKACKPLQIGMDGTRVIRTVELYLDQFLVGKEFPPDVRLHTQAHASSDITNMTNQDVQKYIFEVRQSNAYASEAYSFNLGDTTGEHADILLGSIPEAKAGVTGEHILALMFESEKWALKYSLPVIGHCTDSASNALSALIMLATPSTYSDLDKVPMFIGLSNPHYRFYAPILRPPYPIIAYPCWDHSGRTVIRNLMNEKITIVCGILPSTGGAGGIQCYQIATINDLHTLKRRNPNSIVKHSDINRYIKQNCDATSRLLTEKVIEELAQYVPESKGTQLYLQAAVWTHEPFRNDKFGPPPKVVRSLWAGLMTWRRWYRYVQVTPALTLTNNFISRSHYMTEELLVHAGINHQLTLFYAFPHLTPYEYSMRQTGNRGLEAIHSIFRGGAALLPITAPNLSFREFLAKMNQTNQIHAAEHDLKQIQGHTIVASKKKRKTCAKSSETDSTRGEAYDAYTMPEKFEQFCMELDDACKEGDKDSMTIIAELAPEIEKTLKRIKEWDNPGTPISPPPSDIQYLTTLDSGELSTPDTYTAEEIDSIITSVLGSATDSITEKLADDHDKPPEVEQAYANYVTDVSYVDDSTSTTPASVNMLLSGLQPYREKPSKDRAKRFAASDLPFDKDVPESHDIIRHQYWSLLPDKSIRQAKVFLLSQIIYISEEGKPVSSSIKANPSTYIVVYAYSYNCEDASYSPAGKSGLLKASNYLHVNVSDVISGPPHAKVFNHKSVPGLEDYRPYHNDLDLEIHSDNGDNISESDPTCNSSADEDPYIVEKIVAKRYNSHKCQYEYRVKWLGYDAKENTWELPSNIPSRLLNEYEQTILSTSSTTESRRIGLRPRSSLKSTVKDDFIVNM